MELWLQRRSAGLQQLLPDGAVMWLSAAKGDAGYRKFVAEFLFDNTDGRAEEMAGIALAGIPSITFAAVRFLCVIFAWRLWVASSRAWCPYAIPCYGGCIA